MVGKELIRIVDVNDNFRNIDDGFNIEREKVKIADRQAENLGRMASAQVDFVGKYVEIAQRKEYLDAIQKRTDAIKYKENLVYKMLTDISNFIVDCYDSGIEIDYDENVLNYSQFSLTNLRVLILNYFEFLRSANSNNMSEEEFEVYRENNFIAKIPPFLTYMSDVLFPKEVYIEGEYRSGKFMITKNMQLSESFKEAIKDDRSFEFVDKVPYFQFVNEKIWGPEIYFNFSLIKKSENSRQIKLNDLKSLTLSPFEFDNIFFSTYQCAMNVKIFKNWSNNRQKEGFSIWDPLSIDYHTKASNYVDSRNSDEMALNESDLNAPKKLSYESLKSTDTITDDADKEIFKTTFEETNPSYRFIIPGDVIRTIYEPFTSSVFDAPVLYGNFRFEFNYMWIIDRLYEMAIGEYDSICQNEDIYIQEYSTYLDDLINKYNALYNSLQLTRVAEVRKRKLQRKN